MPDIKLGPSGSETTLPAINWDAGGDLELPVSYKSSAEKSTQLDGTIRINFKGHGQKTWELEWALLPAADILTLIGLAELQEPLRYQNNWIDATWRWVWISGFDYQAIQSTFASTAKYRASMTIEELP